MMMTNTLNSLAPELPEGVWSKLASPPGIGGPFIMLMLSFMLNNVLHVAHTLVLLFIAYTATFTFSHAYVCSTTLDTISFLDMDLFLPLMIILVLLAQLVVKYAYTLLKFGLGC